MGDHDLNENRKSADTLGDSLPVVLNRTVSDFSKSWLAGYQIIDEREIIEDELQFCRKTLASHLAATLADRRQVILDSVDGLDLEPPEARKFSTIVNDLLAAHEVGGGDYFGHLSQYCNIQEAFTSNLFIQQDLYLLPYLFFALGRSSVIDRWSAVGSWGLGLKGSILSLLDGGWFSEMLAMLSEKRRVQEHMLSMSDDPAMTKFLKAWSSRTDSVSNELSAYAVGFLSWNKLKQRFGHGFLGMLSNLRMGDFAVVDPSNPLYAAQDWTKGFLPRGGPNQYRNRTRSQMVTLPTEKFMVGLLHGKPLADFSKNELWFIHKRTNLSIRAKTIDGDLAALSEEFPEVRALLIGELWLALNSIVQVQRISDKLGIASTYIQRSLKDVCSPEAQRLAVELLDWRNRVLGLFSIDPLQTRRHMWFYYQYVMQKISRQQMVEATLKTDPITFRPDRASEFGEHFSRLQRRLRGFYGRGRPKIERYLKRPEDFFFRILDYDQTLVPPKTL